MSIFGCLLIEKLVASVAFELLLWFDFEIVAFGFDFRKAVIGCGKRVVIGIGGIGVVNYKFRFDFNGTEVIGHLE